MYPRSAPCRTVGSMPISMAIPTMAKASIPQSRSAMSSGVPSNADIASELSPGHHHAGDVGSRVPAVFYCSMACWGNILVGRCRSVAGFGHPLHTDCHPADQQAVVEPCAGQAVSPNRSLTCPLGQVARPEKCAQWCGASAVLVFGDLQEAPLVGPLNENRSIAILGSIFSGVGISEKKFSSPETLKFKAYFPLYRHVVCWIADQCGVVAARLCVLSFGHL